MPDEFYARKLKTMFKRHDVDKDGVLTEKDFETIADRFIASGNFTGEKKARTKANLIQIWSKYVKDPNINHPIDADSFVAKLWEKFDDKEHREQVGKDFRLGFENLFHAIDADGDWFIVLNEYEQFFKNFGIDESHAFESFEVLDTDKDDKISLEEFITSGVKFFLTNDKEEPSNLFWGPLF